MVHVHVHGQADLCRLGAPPVSVACRGNDTKINNGHNGLSTDHQHSRRDMIVFTATRCKRAFTFIFIRFPCVMVGFRFTSSDLSSDNEK